MTEEQHLWACVLEVERQHGEGANIFVTERIGALALAGDSAGIERWKAIASRLQAIRRGIDFEGM
jgi:hypothetical protein